MAGREAAIHDTYSVGESSLKPPNEHEFVVEAGCETQRATLLVAAAVNVSVVYMIKPSVYDPSNQLV